MKILHTSDWHLGRVFHERSLIEDQQYALNGISDVIRTGGYDAMIVAGDIFDRAVPPAEAVQLFSSFLTGLRSFSALPVIIIPGNHDSAARLSFCADIISISGIYFKTDPFACAKPVTVVSNDKETADIYAIPFLNPSTFDVHDDGSPAAESSHNSAVSTALDSIKRNMNSGAINICTGHFFAKNGRASDSERRFIGALGEVDASPFDVFDYTALGHLHAPQSAGERVRYSGSLLKYSFSEESDIKGVLSVDVNKKKISAKFIPIAPLHGMKRIKALYNDVLYADEFAQYADDYIEIEFADNYIITEAAARLRERFPNILSVRQNPSLGGGAPFADGEGISTGAEARSVIDDYMLFHKYVYGEEAGAEKVKLLSGIYSEMEEMEKNEA
jgi:exonuclease SbcD